MDELHIFETAVTETKTNSILTSILTNENHETQFVSCLDGKKPMSQRCYSEDLTQSSFL